METQIQTSLSQWQELIQSAARIWEAGGWAMWPIAVVAVVLFGTVTHVWLTLLFKGHRWVSEKTWRVWVEDPMEREGAIGRLMSHAADADSMEAVPARMDEARMEELTPLARDLGLMKVCVAAAPLIGLFGTVTGMLSTFDALASSVGGDQTMGEIADGISVALITTEAGLVVALPGLFFHHQLKLQAERYAHFLGQVESSVAQHIFDHSTVSDTAH